MARISAKIGKLEKARLEGKIPLDKHSEKQPRGRPVTIKASWVRGRADNYRYIFDQIWDHIWSGLSKAKTQQEVIQAIARPEVGSYALDLIRVADVILRTLQDRKFPKRKRESQIDFMADSIAAHGMLTPRSSRDVCERERARIKRVHRILRYEYYVECSCGYKGFSKSHACPKCEAEIQFKTESPFDIAFNH